MATTQPDESTEPATASAATNEPTTSPDTADAADAADAAKLLLEKQDPGFPWVWRQRYFSIDAARGALVYSQDDAQKQIKGAIPLEMISAVMPKDETGLTIDIADRTFVCRVPKATNTSRDDFIAALLDAVASHPHDGPVEVEGLPRCHWKDQDRLLARKKATREERAGKQSRLAREGYPERAVPLTLDWAVALPTYSPPTFTAERNVASEPAQPAGVDWASRASWDGPLALFDGAPRNPIGRTGLGGRGTLPRWGPNQEARVIVSKRDALGGWQVVCVRRTGEQGWSLPGGLLPKGSAAYPTPRQLRLIFGLQATAGSSRFNDERLAKIFPADPSVPQAAAPAPAVTAAEAAVAPTADIVPNASPHVAAAPATAEAPKADDVAWVHTGFSDDSVNTDQAWLESAVAHFFAPDDAADLSLLEGNGLAAVRWVGVPPSRGAPPSGTAGFWHDLQPLHQRWVRKAIMQHAVTEQAAKRGRK